MNWYSRSFKIINFYCNRKPIYDFLLVINSDQSPISHRFRDIVSGNRKLWALLSRGPFEFRHQTWQAQSWSTGLHYGKNRIILSLAILSQYTCVTDRQQTTSYDNNRKFHSNVRLKTHPELCGLYPWTDIMRISARNCGWRRYVYHFLPALRIWIRCKY